MTEYPIIPEPPSDRFNTPQAGLSSLILWARFVFEALTNAGAVAQIATNKDKIEAAGAVATLTQTIGDPPTQAEVQAIQDKVNEIVGKFG